ncbi:unnamed protein product [Arabis nemorensis]|uniref:Uncharacterized protein n=1 Tax=Arabis nemorensis TaxID=586526 RepID=A0A565C6J1_9BRAS|nr:unnamed protein product [Arabis nemorensis]
MWLHRRCLPLAHLANSQVVGFIFCSFDGETQSPPRFQPVSAGASLTEKAITVTLERGHGSPPPLCYDHLSRFVLTVTEPPSLSTDLTPALSATRSCGVELPPPPRDLTFRRCKLDRSGRGTRSSNLRRRSEQNPPRSPVGFLAHDRGCHRTRRAPISVPPHEIRSNARA